MEIKHEHTEEGGTFYAGDQDDPLAEMAYAMRPDHKMVIQHTEVRRQLEGKGVARQLIAAAVDYARENSILIIPVCSYARSEFEKVKEYQDLLA